MLEQVILQFTMKFLLNNQENRYLMDKYWQIAPSETLSKVMTFSFFVVG